MEPESLLTPWLAWFLIGIAFAGAELFLPFFIFLFFGIGCFGVVVALLLFDLPLSQQLTIFIIVTISSLVLLRTWMMRTFRGIKTDQTDKDFDDFPHGERVTVIKPIVPPGSGRIQHRGTAWDAVADEVVDAGQTVEIVGYAGNSRQVFHVRKP